MNTIINDIKTTFRNGGITIRLIFLNSVIFILFRIVFLIYNIPGIESTYPCSFWFSMPSLLNELLLKPWTLITYMFYHEDVFHFLFNMVNLYWFGKIFAMYFDEKKMLGVYLLGGIAGGLLYFVTYNLFPTILHPAILMGASGSIIAIMTASAIFAPNMRLMMLFFGEVKLIYIWLFSILMFMLMTASGSNVGGNLAHIGGAVFGYLWILQYRKGNDISFWLSRFVFWLPTIFKRRKMKVTYKRPPIDDLQYNKQKVVNQAEIDKILDKISKGGYNSLTSAEKQTLFQMSNQN